MAELQTKSERSQPRKVVNCAHRGASGYAPENTLAAMRLAMEMGADMIELDVQQTADDRLAVMHDEKLNRTTSGKGYLWKKTLSELQNYEAGSWFDLRFSGEPIPELKQVIELVRGKILLNIEVKLHGHERNVSQLVIDTLRSQGFENKCILTSFDQPVANQLKALAPNIQVGYILDRRRMRDEVFTAHVDILSAHYKLVDAGFVERAHARGKQVFVWTVNEKPRMESLIDLGVDGIITNYPDRLAEVIAAKRK